MKEEAISFIGLKNPTGRERNPCPLCEKSFKPEDEVMSCVKNVWKGHYSYGLVHSKCFFKLLILKYNFDLEEIKKEVILEKLE